VEESVASETAKALDPFTIEVSASERPKRILDRFPEPPAAEASFSVTTDRQNAEPEKLAALLGDLQAGLGDLAAGRVSARR
jgi:hypothetical protein